MFPLLLRSFLFLHAFPSLFFRRKCVFPLVFLRGPSLPYPSIPQRGLRGSGRYFLTLKRRCARTVEMTVYAIRRHSLYIYSSQLFKASFPAPQRDHLSQLHFRQTCGPTADGAPERISAEVRFECVLKERLQSSQILRSVYCSIRFPICFLPIIVLSQYAAFYRQFHPGPARR